MKTWNIILPGILLAFASCSIKNNTNQSTSQNVDSVKTSTGSADTSDKKIFAKMQVKDTIKIGDPVQLKFTVYNNADTVQQFCKWHTPFEPLMSKYLEVRDASGTEMLYQGAMAKRIMPPPLNSYIKVNPKDSTSTNVDLLKAYAITKPSTYSVKYVGENMSGIAVKDSITFVYVK